MEIQRSEKEEKRTLDIQWVKEHLVCRLVNRKNNEELLKEIPYRKFYDLAVVYYVPMQQVEDGMLFWTIRKEQAKVLGLEEESLFTLALENTRRRFPIQFSALEQAIRQFTLEAGIDLEEECKCDEEAETGQETGGMYLLSNTFHTYGAVAMLYPDVWEGIADRFQSDLIILPSSCHEVLVLPYTEEVSVSDLAEIVFTVNRECVAPEDMLSDSVYLYRRIEKRIVMAGRTEQEEIK